jgi:hypothetical protein
MKNIIIPCFISALLSSSITAFIISSSGETMPIEAHNKAIAALQKEHKLEYTQRVIEQQEIDLVREAKDLNDVAAFTAKGSVERIYITGKMIILQNEAITLDKQVQAMRH